MEYKTIVLENRDGVMLLTLNRPEKLNAVNGNMFRELKSALTDIAHDDEVRVLVLTGAGRAFCAAADMKEDDKDRMQTDRSPTQEEIRLFIEKYSQGIVQSLRSMEKPTIAMVNGLAVADGMDWALSCDIRIGSENARFMNAFVRMGAFPSTGGSWFYPRFMGFGRALEFLYTGDWMDAEEACKLGILNRIVSASQLEIETMKLARKLANGPPIALKLIKQLTYKGLEMGLDSLLKLASEAEAMTIVTEDHKEAVEAFKQKRDPVFRGR